MCILQYCYCYHISAGLFDTCGLCQNGSRYKYMLSPYSTVIIQSSVAKIHWLRAPEMGWAHTNGPWSLWKVSSSYCIKQAVSYDQLFITSTDSDCQVTDLGNKLNIFCSPLSHSWPMLTSMKPIKHEMCLKNDQPTVTIGLHCYCRQSLVQCTMSERHQRWNSTIYCDWQLFTRPDNHRHTLNTTTYQEQCCVSHNILLWPITEYYYYLSQTEPALPSYHPHARPWATFPLLLHFLPPFHSPSLVICLHIPARCELGAFHSFIKYGILWQQLHWRSTNAIHYSWTAFVERQC